jgi:hypothetical protein
VPPVLFLWAELQKKKKRKKKKEITKLGCQKHFCRGHRLDYWAQLGMALSKGKKKEQVHNEPLQDLLLGVPMSLTNVRISSCS